MSNQHHKLLLSEGRPVALYHSDYRGCMVFTAMNRGCNFQFRIVHQKGGYNSAFVYDSEQSAVFNAKLIIDSMLNRKTSEQ